MHVQASRPRPARRRHGRRSAADARRTGRAGSTCLSGPRTCTLSLQPSMAAAAARRPARHEPGSTPSLSREAAAVHPPTPSLTPLSDLISTLLSSLRCLFCLGCLLLQNVLSAMAATPPLDVVASTAMFAMHEGHINQAFPLLPPALFVFSR